MSKTFDHLLPVFRPYARWSAEKRVGWIRQDRWINYTRAEQILGRLAALLDYPPRDRMPCLLLFGVGHGENAFGPEVPARPPFLF